ncbi:MAG: GreA/GreB family elongation factor [Spirochaetes bacterium]|jgi:transcription elongation factor GreA|nr:GreA/GreB family elongation factor [Spirochaetota bacterium]
MEQFIDRLESLLKEESFGRMGASSVGISRFKVLEAFFNESVQGNASDEIYKMCEDHLEETPSSVTSLYISGLIAFHSNIIDGKNNLLYLVKTFNDLQKWAVVEHLSEKVLEYGENTAALKALALSLEKLKRRKEAVPVWEELIKINRFDADIARKLSQSLEEEDQTKSTQYLKMALEGYIKNADVRGINDIWPRVVEKCWDDIPYFERIDRMLADLQRKDISIALLKMLYEKHKGVDISSAIFFLKKALQYAPKDNEFRYALIALYKLQYKEHSQLNRFIKLSHLDNTNTPVLTAIKAFENNIIFDADSYVFHRTWGLGKIVSIDEENVIINFDDKPEHRMSVNMALQSLVALNNDHLYVKQYLEPEKMQALFKDDVVEFIKVVLKSYDDTISVPELKRDLIPLYVSTKNWSRWWTKVRGLLKKDPSIGFAPNKKDQLVLREKPISYADELLKKFTNSDSFSQSLDIAYEFANNVDVKEGSEQVLYIIDYFTKAASSKSDTKLILSYFILSDLEKFAPGNYDLEPVKQQVVSYIVESNDLPLISMKISSYDNKKDFVNLIREHRSNWVQVLSTILFEVPVRIHKYIFNLLILEKEYGVINEFIVRITAASKENAEVFLWVARNILLKNWTYEWLDYSKSGVILSLFRAYNSIDKSETKGNRLKNMAYEILFENEQQLLHEIVEESDESFLGKLYDIAANTEHIDDSELDKFEKAIRSRFPDFKAEKSGAVVSDENEEEKIFVTGPGLDRKKKELNHMRNVEMVQLQKGLASTVDVSGDSRENVDYNALLEQQSILKKSISKLDSELKIAEIIDLDDVDKDKVDIGSVVTLRNSSDDQTVVITILGPWDVDFEKGILSYRSDVASTLRGKTIGEEVTLHLGGRECTYIIESLSVYSVS